MEPVMRKELDALLIMAENWSKSYLSMVEGSSGNEYLITDLTDDVAVHMMPQLRAYVNAEHLTEKEVAEFTGSLSKVVDRFIVYLEGIQRGNDYGKV